MGPNPKGSGFLDRLSFNPFVLSLSSTSCQCYNTKNSVPRQGKKGTGYFGYKNSWRWPAVTIPASLTRTARQSKRKPGTSAGLINGKTQCLLFRTWRGGCRPVHQSLSSILNSPAEASRRWPETSSAQLGASRSHTIISDSPKKTSGGEGRKQE